MQLRTYLRLSLLGPILLPPMWALISVGGIASFGLVMTVGIVYYGTGYVTFAVAVLYWLRVPRTDAEIRRAAMYAPLLAAPLLAMSVMGTERASNRAA